MEEKRTYIPQLTFLRFGAALLVVLFHYGKDIFPFNQNGISEIVKNGNIAVSFFFFLSGVVLTINYWGKEKVDFLSFIKKRLARIYPTYLLAFILTLLSGMLILGAYPTGLSVVLQIFSLQAWVPGYSLGVNSPGWSISVEMFFYILFPFLLVWLRQLKMSQLLAITIGFWLLGLLQIYYCMNEYFFSGNHALVQFILYFPVWHLNTFLAGILGGNIILRKRDHQSSEYWLYRVMYMAGIAGVLMVLLVKSPLKMYLHNGLLAPFYFMIIVGLSLDKSLFTSFLANKLFVLLGNASYALYIFQLPLFTIMFYFLAGKVNVQLGLSIYIITLIIFSIIVYQFFERKINRYLLKKWFPPKES